MGKGRLEAFSDGVLAIIITIMVLELRPPHEAEFAALRPLLPVLLSYVLSFVFLGIYWNNHHHMLHVTRQVTGAVLWANLHLLFWLSLIPFVTAWAGETSFAPIPTALYGAVLLMSAFAYWFLVAALVRAPGQTDTLATALGNDAKGRISPAIYAIAIPIAFFVPFLSLALYWFVAAMWIVPDSRIERRITG
jgi:uncharacterized membrane protein